jgi:hypothetical protein
MALDRSDKIFLGLMGVGFLAFLMCVHKGAQGDDSGLAKNATVVETDDTQIVGMSLSATRQENINYSPFKGRYLLPPPLASLLPSVTADAMQGVATPQSVDGT